MASINDLDFQGLYEPSSTGSPPTGYVNFTVVISATKIKITSSTGQITRYQVADLPLTATGSIPQWMTPRVPISIGGTTRYIRFYLTNSTIAGDDPFLNPATPSGLQIRWYNTSGGTTPIAVSTDSSRVDNLDVESNVLAPNLPSAPISTPVPKKKPCGCGNGYKSGKKTIDNCSKTLGILTRLITLFKSYAYNKKALILIGIAILFIVGGFLVIHD